MYASLNMYKCKPLLIVYYGQSHPQNIHSDKWESCLLHVGNIAVERIKGPCLLFCEALWLEILEIFIRNSTTVIVVIIIKNNDNNNENNVSVTTTFFSTMSVYYKVYYNNI